MVSCITRTLIAIATCSCMFTTAASAQKLWHLQKPVPKKSFGIDLPGAYQALKNNKPSPVIVAVIDNGTDITHKKLQPYIHVNAAEIRDNNKDDDANGYTDDVYGWNFLGGRNSNIGYAAMEETRQYQALKKKYADTTQLTEEQKQELEGEYNRYLLAQKSREEDVKWASKLYARRNNFFLKTISSLAGEKNIGESLAERKEDAQALLVANSIDDDSARAAIVGDNLLDPTERIYGNANPAAGDPKHGTHTAGIVADIAGMDPKGNTWLTILPVRAVPVNGDERDKDVANAIRYAVDNGAKVINMSFGKNISPDREEVVAAIKYAMEHDVLMIHGAGNDARHLDSNHTRNFPNPWLDSATIAGNWIEVGATTKNRKRLIASYSNYGRKAVDILAPGSDIYSTVPPDTFAFYSGTSMAAPVVAGVAALIRSYYPHLTAADIKHILVNSVTKYEGYYPLPGKPNFEAPLWYFSRSAGILNAAQAVELAEDLSARKKN